MLIIRNLNQIKPAKQGLALTIGNFDGAHLGHLQVFNQVKKAAAKKDLLAAILTFEPHPSVLIKAQVPRDFRINSLSQKLKIFQETGIDLVIILPFNKELAEISAEDFIKKILVEALNIKHLTIGYDFVFGKNRQGNFELLARAAKNFHFDLQEISAVKNCEHTCSSSLIRTLICEGKIAAANQFLGRNFTICGLVHEGRKLASQLGFPTANLAAKPQIIKPKFGVYKTISFLPHLGKKFSSITNFGVKPTIGGSIAPIFETHILGFSQKIYGQKIFVEFLDFIREEKKFSSLEELRKQIENDVKDAWL